MNIDKMPAPERIDYESPNAPEWQHYEEDIEIQLRLVSEDCASQDCPPKMLARIADMEKKVGLWAYGIENQIRTIETSVRIKEAREQLNLTQEEIGKIAGVSKQAAGQWEKAARELSRIENDYLWLPKDMKMQGMPLIEYENLVIVFVSPSISALNNLERETRLSQEWVLSGVTPMFLSAPEELESSHSSVSNTTAVPVVGTAQLGDNAHWSELEYPVGHGDGYIDWPTADPNAYALRCKGDSMAPRIKPNEFVVVEPGVEPTSGDEVMIKATDGRVMVKELLYIRDEIVHLASVNEAHGRLSIPLEEIEKMHYIGGLARKSKWRPE